MKNKGFSLVELIVVIAIMAILVGVAVPVYSSYIEKTQKAKDEQMIDEIKHAIEIASVGETWGVKYGITNNGTYIGAIVLSPNAQADVQQEAVIGTALEDALVQTFGSDYKTKLTLSYDGWEGSLAAGNLDAFVGSNYYGNISTLMGDINSLTGALKLFLTNDPDVLAGTGFKAWAEGANVDVNDSQSLANAAILYVANGASSINKEAFLARWNEPSMGALMTGFNATGMSKISAVAAEYAKAEAVVNWMGCSALQTAFSQASAGLGNIQEGSDLDSAFAPLTDLFGDHINGDNACQACVAKSSYGDYYGQYIANANCEKDAQAYLALLGQVSSSQDKILSDIANPNLYAEDTLVSYVNNYVNVAGVLSQINAPEGTVVIVFSMDANGALKSNVYPLDYID